jgi:hypothetical protein
LLRLGRPGLEENSTKRPVKNVRSEKIPDHATHGCKESHPRYTGQELVGETAHRRYPAGIEAGAKASIEAGAKASIEAGAKASVEAGAKASAEAGTAAHVGNV